MRTALSVCSLVIVLSAAASDASAQACAAPVHPSFEFQVDQPAAYLGHTTQIPRPAHDRFMRIREHPEALVVQFVVDTLGVPDLRSFHVLQSPSTVAADSVRTALLSWRFSFAMRAGCRVPQVVQTAVTH